MLAKATALVHRSGQLVKQYDPDLPATTEFWLKLRATQKAISEYTIALPPLWHKSHISAISSDSDIVVLPAAHMLASTASLVLHSLFIDDDAESQEKGLTCIRRIMSIVNELDDADPKFAFGLGLPLLASAEFIRKEINRLNGNSESQLLSELKGHRIKLAQKIKGLLIWKGRAIDIYVKKFMEEMEDAA